MSTTSDIETAGARIRRASCVRLDPLNPAIVSDARDVSVLAEEFRNLAFQVEESQQAHDSSLVLAVTSSEPETGKTLLSLNLALTLARERDRNVLLLEADLRRPSLHNYLERVPGAQGLWQLLRDDLALEETVLSVWATSLKVLLAGASGKVANVMAQQRAARLVKTARSLFDLVIVDSPPLLLASGRSAAARADRVLLVVRAGQTRRQSIHEALSIVGPQKTLGLVLNATRFAPDHSYFRYRKAVDSGDQVYPPLATATEVEPDGSLPASATDSPGPAYRWQPLLWLLLLLLLFGLGFLWP